MRRGTRSGLVSLGQIVLSVSPASVIRTLLGGAKEGIQSLRDTYRAVAPFSPLREGEGRRLLAKIPEVELSEAAPLPEAMVVDMRYMGIDGATPFEDVAAILALAIARQPTALLEIGTFWGSTTVNFARNLPLARVHTIDLPEACKDVIAGQPVNDLHLIESRRVGHAFHGTEVEDRITQHFGDTATFDYAAIRDELTFFMIDGSHTYEYAKSDTLKALGLVRSPSTLVWHDCNEWQPGVTRWLVEMIDTGYAVKRIKGTAVAFLVTSPSPCNIA